MYSCIFSGLFIYGNNIMYIFQGFLQRMFIELSGFVSWYKRASLERIIKLKVDTKEWAWK